MAEGDRHCLSKRSTTKFDSSSPIGKEKGYLLYDEVNELLPADITSSEELDDLFSTFGSAGIEVVDSEKTYRDEKLQGEGGEEGDLDLTPGALDKTNDPVRMYLREMGTVPLLTREGEVAIAKRIEQGKLAVIKSISRTPKVTQEVIEMGEQLKRGERTVRELVVFNEEEITDEKIARAPARVPEADRPGQGWRIDDVQKLEEKFGDVPKADKRKYRRARWKIGRARDRAVARDPEDRVHRDGQAPADRRHQAGRRGHPGEAARSAPHRPEARSEGQAEAARGREEDPTSSTRRSSARKSATWRRSSSSRSRS